MLLGSPGRLPFWSASRSSHEWGWSSWFGFLRCGCRWWTWVESIQPQTPLILEALIERSQGDGEIHSRSEKEVTRSWKKRVFMWAVQGRGKEDATVGVPFKTELQGMLKTLSTYIVLVVLKSVLIPESVMRFQKFFFFLGIVKVRLLILMCWFTCHTLGSVPPKGCSS